MALARDLLKIYGLIFGNLLIILSVQFIIVAFTFSEEDSGFTQEQTLQVLSLCVPVLLAGVILVAIILQRQSIPFYWVGTHQMPPRAPPPPARAPLPRAPPPGYPHPSRPYAPYPPYPSQSRIPPREPHPPGGDDRREPREQAVTHDRDPATPAEQLPIFRRLREREAVTRSHPVPPDPVSPSSHPATASPLPASEPYSSTSPSPPLPPPPSTSSGPSAPSRSHSLPHSPSPSPNAHDSQRFPGPSGERPSIADNPNYLRYSRGLHYAPRYHGPRYYQPAHRQQPANMSPTFHHYTTRPYPQRGVRPSGPQRKPLYQPRYTPYQRGTHMGLEVKEALHLPSFRYMFLAFIGSLVLGYCSLTLGGVWLAAFPFAFVIAFSFPPLMWIAYIYQRTKERLEPQRLVFIALSWGMISTIPALVFNSLGALLLDADLNKLFEEGGGIGPSELAAVAVVAPLVEEFFKPLGLLLIFRRLESSYTGVLYGVACGMGFALIENMLYELSFLFMPGADVTAVWTFNSFARGVGSTLLHAVGPAFVGFALASVRNRGTGSPWVAGAYLLGVGMHAAWNASATLTLYLGDDEFLGILEIVLLVVLFVACLVILRALLSASLAQQKRRIAVTGPIRPVRPPPWT